MRNGFFCVYCNNELHNSNKTICNECRVKRNFVRKLLSMRLPDEPPKVEHKCVYCVDGICADAFNTTYAQPCNGDLLCKRGKNNG